MPFLIVILYTILCSLYNNKFISALGEIWWCWFFTEVL